MKTTENLATKEAALIELMKALAKMLSEALGSSERKSGEDGKSGKPVESYGRVRRTLFESDDPRVRFATTRTKDDLQKFANQLR